MFVIFKPKSSKLLLLIYFKTVVPDFVNFRKNENSPEPSINWANFGSTKIVSVKVLEFQLCACFV